jgi:2-C-methyl-D-erythritol 4-phosphate cytidylyltransferase
MSYSFILLSGGVGSRMHQPLPKQYMLLAGKPMIMHVLDKIDAIDEIDQIIIVCSKDYISSIDLMLEQYGINKAVEYADAGDTRQASVLSGLRKVKSDQVIIHEAARPFVTVEDYRELIDAPAENAMVGLDIPFTVLKGHENVEGLLTRSELVNVQLPQKFNKDLLLKAHEKAEREGLSFTEDASLLYYYNPDLKIRIIRGKDYNTKITTHLDMLTGEIIYDEIFRRRK